jgi:formyltetrahydrofolate hydrolase
MAKVCVLAKEGSMYANLIIRELQLNQLDFDVIWVKNNRKKESRFARLLLVPYNFHKSISTGRFKALPIYHWWTWSLFFKLRRQKISRRLNDLVKTEEEITNIGFFVPSVNHVATYAHLRARKFEIGILAGVDIVHEQILSEFSKVCLNAHPAPLPECRGGGALENTLLEGLMPSTSIHQVTAGIDEGDIYEVKSVDLDSDDSFRSIYLKLNILGAKLLVKTAMKLLDEEIIHVIKNEGRLNFWKDLTIERQRQAHENLKEILPQKQ